MSLRKRIWSVLYNLDRTVASLFGAPPQATVSAEAARANQRGAWWGRTLCWLLDKIDPGHCDDADAHADKLESADNGKLL